MKLATTLLFLLLLSACQVDEPRVADGCASDADCRLGRVCVDRICSYSEDAAREETTEIVARRILATLAANNEGGFSLSWPDTLDYEWGFDFGPDAASADPTRQALVIDREKLLIEDFRAIVKEKDWTGATFVAFEPGSYAPIPTGQDRARLPLDRLRDSRIVYELDGKQNRLTVAQLIRLRGRWRVFALVR
ncbi:MAG: hypothetical protein C4523_04010 [Myxococcales bacterium]|nr:MAG: hypothetical protein C4523_04010 [Myxococcales bacterium]